QRLLRRVPERQDHQADFRRPTGSGNRSRGPGANRSGFAKKIRDRIVGSHRSGRCAKAGRVRYEVESGVRAMRVTPIEDSLPGEHVVSVHPVMSPDAKSHWHRRLNLYTGRALSDIALTSEQQGRAGRLATSGQMLSPGVVSGLEVTIDSTPVKVNKVAPPADKPVAPDAEPDDKPDVLPKKRLFDWFYNLAPGFGITASGEDVNVSTALRLDVMSVPVYAPAEFLPEVHKTLAGDKAQEPGD